MATEKQAVYISSLKAGLIREFSPSGIRYNQPHTVYITFDNPNFAVVRTWFKNRDEHQFGEFDAEKFCADLVEYISSLVVPDSTSDASEMIDELKDSIVPAGFWNHCNIEKYLYMKKRTPKVYA